MWIGGNGLEMTRIAAVVQEAGWLNPGHQLRPDDIPAQIDCLLHPAAVPPGPAE